MPTKTKRKAPTRKARVSQITKAMLIQELEALVSVYGESEVRKLLEVVSRIAAGRTVDGVLKTPEDVRRFRRMMDDDDAEGMAVMGLKGKPKTKGRKLPKKG